MHILKTVTLIAAVVSLSIAAPPRYSVYRNSQDPNEGTSLITTALDKRCEDLDYCNTGAELRLERVYNAETGSCVCLTRYSDYIAYKEKLDTFSSYLLEAKAALENSDTNTRLSELRALHERTVEKRQAPTETAAAPTSIDTAVPTFIPPPKLNITPQLVNESLQVQPQNKATISSVVIHIMEEVITFLFQMDGFVAGSIPVNASTSMVCGAIGSNPEPDIQIVPKCVQPGQGAQQTVVANCRCIAANMYTPNIINLYIQNEEGEVYSLTASNKIIDVDKMDTSQPLAVSLVPIAAGTQKRDISAMANVIPRESRQVMSADMHKRGISEADMYSVTMSKEACEAMTCHNTGKPPMFNPFTLDCWCFDAPYIEDNPSAWTPSS